MNFPILKLKVTARVLVLFFLIFFLVTSAFAAAGKPFCEKVLNPNPKTEIRFADEEPIVIPEPPKTEPKIPEPDLVPQPKQPRRAPNPHPDRPLLPTHDPKDIVPAELYLKDELAKRIYQTFPESLLELMRSVPATEQLEIVPRLRAIGVSDPMDHEEIIRFIQSDLEWIRSLELGNESMIEQGVFNYIEQEYGSEAVQNLTFRIDQTLPTLSRDLDPRAAPASARIRPNFFNPFHWFKTIVKPSQPVAKSELTLFFSSRREIYNLIAQGVGWEAMKKYPAQSISLLINEPALPVVYERFYLAFRQLNYLTVAELRSPMELNAPELREQSSIGREIVSVDGVPVQNELGHPVIEINEVNGVAVGKNGLALAHEMAKAGFQMATALEATQRMGLKNQERYDLDLVTNTNSAEVRQAIYGPAIATRILGNFQLVFGKGPRFYRLFEQVFVIHSESAFNEIISLACEPKLESNAIQYARFKSLLGQWIGE